MRSLATRNPSSQSCIGAGSRPSRDYFPEAAPRELVALNELSLYRRLYETLRQAIVDGIWNPGELLPSEFSLGARFGISRITVRHALQLLQTDGYIRTQRARRAIVLSRNPLLQGGAGADSLAELIRAARDFDLRIRSWRTEPAPDLVQLFEIPLEKTLCCLRGVLLRDGHRLARTTMYFHPFVGERLRRQDFDDAVVFRVLQRKLGIKISDVKMTVWADIADAQDVAQLGCQAGDAIFCSRIVYRNEQGLPIEVAYLRFPAALHRFSFTVDVNAE